VHVNLIPLNEVPGSRFTRSEDADMDEFVRRLVERGISTTVRDTRGSDIDAACGQLAASES
jgi:23S rRNA (adenine2503-C2)-methyltransferase